MNVFEKEKKVVSLFFCQNQDQGRKHLAVNRQQIPLRASKVLLYNQDEWLQEIEEHERKSDTSEKQSVEMKPKKHVRNVAGVRQH